MNKKGFFTFTIIILTASALLCSSAKLPAAQAQTATWQLSVTGLVQNPLNFSLNVIQAMPQTTEFAAMYCVDSPSAPVEQGNWTGVTLAYILQQANVSSDATKLAFFATDGFKTDLTVGDAQNNDVLVAYELNNVSTGGFQLVVPFHWGYKWISDLIQISLVNYNFLGTEESYGYSDEALTPNTLNSPPPLPATTPNPSSNPTPSPTATAIPQATPIPTESPSTPTPTINPTTSPIASKTKSSSTLIPFIYMAIVSAIAVIVAVSAVFLTKRRRIINSNQG